MWPQTSEECNARAAEWRVLAERMRSQELAWPENKLWNEMAAMNEARAEFWEDDAERLLAIEMAEEPEYETAGDWAADRAKYETIV